MTELETKINQVESDQRSFEATVKMYMQKMDKDMEDFKTELRDRDNQRHEEILSLREELSNLTKHLQTTSITMSAGIGALVVTMIVYLLTKG